MNWLVNDATFGLFTFTDLTRGIAGVVEVPYTIALSRACRPASSAAVGSNAVQILPPLSWIAVIARRRAPRPLCRRPAARDPGRRLLPLSRGLRPVAERDGDARLDRSSPCRSASPAVSSLGIAGYRWPAFERAMRAGPRPDADRADLRLSGADPLPLRLRPGLLDRRDDHLRHAADGPHHHRSRSTTCPPRSATSAR